MDVVFDPDDAGLDPRVRTTAVSRPERLWRKCEGERIERASVTKGLYMNERMAVVYMDNWARISMRVEVAALLVCEMQSQEIGRAHV